MMAVVDAAVTSVVVAAIGWVMRHFPGLSDEQLLAATRDVGEISKSSFLASTQMVRR